MKDFIARLKAGVATVAALGGIKRRGIGALKGYPGTITGHGFVTHNSGPKKGTKTYFTVEGNVGESAS